MTAPQPPAQPSPIETAAITCNLGLFTPAQRARHAALLRELMVDLPVARAELTHGYELHYRREAGTLAKLAEWIDYESQCCAFFTFDLQVAPRNGPIVLRWHGAEPAAKEIITAAIAGAANATTAIAGVATASAATATAAIAGDEPSPAPMR